MTIAARPVREKLACSVFDAVQATRGMGRVMLSAASNGATHERIGVVDAVMLEDGFVRMAGAAHDARIDLAVITAVVADRSGRMKDRVLPRIEFQNASGETLFSIIGLDGLDPFDTALSAIAAGEALPEKARPAPSGDRPADVAETDPGAVPLHAATASGETIRIGFVAPGLEQQWQGQVADVKPAMGFINIIQPDFHLHLKAEAVSRWARAEAGGEVRLEAVSAEGTPLGLSLSGPASTF